MPDFVEIAARLATGHHNGRIVDGVDYLQSHVEPVALQSEVIAVGFKLSGEEIRHVIATSYLYDVVRLSTMTIPELIYAGIPEIVCNSVALLQPRTGISNGIYLNSIATAGFIPAIVKLADSMCQHRDKLASGRVEEMLKHTSTINYMSTVLARLQEKRAV